MRPLLEPSGRVVGRPVVFSTDSRSLYRLDQDYPRLPLLATAPGEASPILASDYS